jgi:hypothetical protein
VATAALRVLDALRPWDRQRVEAERLVPACLNAEVRASIEAYYGLAE